MGGLVKILRIDYHVLYYKKYEDDQNQPRRPGKRHHILPQTPAADLGQLVCLLSGLFRVTRFKVRLHARADASL